MEAQGGRPIEWGPLTGGFILGWFACWAIFAVALLVSYNGLGDSAWGDVVPAIGLGAVPVVAVVAVVLRRRRGQLVAGALMGLAVGSVVAAGVCTTTLAAGAL